MVDQILDKAQKNLQESLGGFITGVYYNESPNPNDWGYVVETGVGFHRTMMQPVMIQEMTSKIKEAFEKAKNGYENCQVEYYGGVPCPRFLVRPVG